MDIQIFPGKLKGKITVIPSKSQAHRLLICAAFADKTTELICPQTNQDIDATADCLRALGANIIHTDTGYSINPIIHIPKSARLNCRESGSTLRFLLPIVGALGVDTVFHMHGRLPNRPLSPLWEEMERMGCTLTRPTENTLSCTGKLRGGEYTIDGSVSSQYITGLLFATALLPGESKLTITGKTESKSYIALTRQALAAFGVNTDDYRINGTFPFHSPGSITVEGDWSNGAFFLAANTMGSQIQVDGLWKNSLQGDRSAAEILQHLNKNITVDAADIPDLVPILAVAAASANGAEFVNIRRLRLKESDRVETVIHMLAALGIHAKATENTLKVFPGKFTGGTVDAAGDHRIAMSAAIAATACSEPLTILGAQCVEKSYPTFWDEYRRLGGNYELYIR